MDLRKKAGPSGFLPRVWLLNPECRQDNGTAPACWQRGRAVGVWKEPTAVSRTPWKRGFFEISNPFASQLVTGCSCSLLLSSTWSLALPDCRAPLSRSPTAPWHPRSLMGETSTGKNKGRRQASKATPAPLPPQWETGMQRTGLVPFLACTQARIRAVPATPGLGARSPMTSNK